MTEVLLSLVTPTYNRANTLPRLWESLNRQRDKCFEWIVVDDGSVDETPSLIEAWTAEAEFPIIYHHKENGGLNSAVNAGKALVSSDYTVVIDSDDELLDDAIEVIKQCIDSTGFADTEDIYELVFRCVDDNGDLVGPPLPQPIMCCSRLEAYYRHKIRIEGAGVVKTRVLRTLKFLEARPPDHIPIEVTYDELPDSLKAVYVDHPIRRYYQHDGVARMTDGWDRSKNGIKHAQGKYFHRRAILNHETGYFMCDPKRFVGSAVRMSRFGLHIGRSLRDQWRELSNAPARLLWLVGLLPGVMKYRKDCRRGYVWRHKSGVSTATSTEGS